MSLFPHQLPVQFALHEVAPSTIIENLFLFNKGKTSARDAHNLGCVTV